MAWDGPAEPHLGIEQNLRRPGTDRPAAENLAAGRLNLTDANVAELDTVPTGS